MLIGLDFFDEPFGYSETTNVEDSSSKTIFFHHSLRSWNPRFTLVALWWVIPLEHGLKYWLAFG
jgi:hypothetical protein